MSPTADQPHAGLRNLAGVAAGEAFFGRQAELAALERRLRRNGRRPPQRLTLTGPRGAGKSALLRRGALAWWRPGAELTPIYLDCRRLAESAPAEGLRMATRSALTQALLAGGALETDRADAADEAALLAATRHGKWRGLEPFIRESAVAAQGADGGAEAGAAGLAALLRAIAETPLARPVVLADGLTGLPGDGGRRWLRGLDEAARLAGCGLLAEAPESTAEAGAEADPDGPEAVALEALEPASALALAQHWAGGRGVTLNAGDVLEVAERLGRWPGWVIAWARCLPFEPIGRTSRRLAETAYADLLAESPWSRRLAARLSGAVAAGARAAALRLICEKRGDAAAFDGVEAMGRLGLAADEADRALGELAAAGLLRRAGLGWRGPAEPALADWAALALDQAASSPEAARLGLLARRLSEAGAADDGERRTVARLVPQVLAALDGQAIPEVLLRYYDYYEAAGRLDPARRLEAILKSHQKLLVPEIVGVAAGGGGAAAAGGAWHARGFAAGNYQRASEELWLALDLSETRALTTPEIEEALGAARRLRRRTDAAECRLWLIVGESVSPDGLELLRREKVYCSNVEQLSLLAELLADMPLGGGAEGTGQPGEAGGGGARAAKASRPRETPELDGAAAGGAKLRGVIDLAAAASAPQGETSTLRLPAREESEYIAALMAEKIAIRADLPQHEAGKVKTAVLEGVLNAIEHSPNPEKLIEVQFHLRPDALEVVIENEGRPFEGGAPAPPDPRSKLKAGNKRGWGITLMRKFMDEVLYEPFAAGTRLRLRKLRRGGEGVGGAAGTDGAGAGEAGNVMKGK